MHRLLAILVALVLTLSSLSQAGASTMRTLTCASARYRMTFPASWKVTHGCGTTMILDGRAGNIGMVVANSILPGWNTDLGRGLVKLFMASEVTKTMHMTILKAALISTRRIAGRTFVQGQEEATDNAAIYIIAVLESANHGRMYDFALLLRESGDGAVDRADTTTGLAVWNSIRLL